MSGGPERDAEKQGAQGWIFSPRGQVVAALLSGALLLAGAVVGWSGGPALVIDALRWSALGVGLLYGGRSAIGAAREYLVDIDVLMVVAAVLAAAIGEVGEGALLLSLFVLAGGLEDLAMARAMRSVTALHAMMPTSAERWEGEQSGGHWVSVPPESLRAGDRVRIKPGEQVPADARVVAGRTSVDQASLTGESRPRDVAEGDEVFGGTVNVGDVVECLVMREAGRSALARVLHLVTQAQQQREPIQRLIDRLNRPYAACVFGASLLVFFVWRLVLKHPAQDAMYTAVALLIVASPCALVLATPTATLAGISRAARGGVLFKGGAALERLARMGAVAFDKTGTLTVGRPEVKRIEAVGWSDEARLLSVARALEETSTHPISHAVVSAAKARCIEAAAANDVRYDPGRGVRGVIDGVEARMGSLPFTGPLIPACFSKYATDRLSELQGRGLIGNVCVHNGGVAVFVLEDVVRPGAEQLVNRLHELGVRPVVMLTGDNRLTGESVGTQLGLDRVHAELLPEEKVEHVKVLKAELARDDGPKERVVGVIGDGVNDAPALAMAGVSIAIGSIGSDAALENADIVLLADDLSVVPWALVLARRVRRTITINLGFALGAIALMAVGVVAGSLAGWRMPLWLGVIGHEGGTLLVVGHSLTLLWGSGPHGPQAK